jgi:predicted DNA-binding transcriptional regulator YafY
MNIFYIDYCDSKGKQGKRSISCVQLDYFYDDVILAYCHFRQEERRFNVNRINFVYDIAKQSKVKNFKKYIEENKHLTNLSLKKIKDNTEVKIPVRVKYERLADDKQIEYILGFNFFNEEQLHDLGKNGAKLLINDLSDIFIPKKSLIFNKITFFLLLIFFVWYFY